VLNVVKKTIRATRVQGRLLERFHMETKIPSLDSTAYTPMRPMCKKVQQVANKCRGVHGKIARWSSVD
jgi:hypothetical protein